MDEGLKQRLVGAAVLVLLAVIFVPMLLETDPEPDAVGFDLGASPATENGFSSRVIPLEDSARASGEAVAPPAPEPVPIAEEDEEAVPDSGAGSPESPTATGVSPDGEGEAETLAAVVLEPEPLTAVVLEPEGSEGAGAPEALEENAAAGAERVAEQQAPPSAWAAQVGSFAERRNALVLRNRLRAKGYPAFTEAVVGEQGEVTRVLVGPEAARDRTLATIEALRRDAGLDGFVVRHPRN